MNLLSHDISSWDSFADSLRTLGAKQKGDAFEELTRHYLTLHPTYATRLNGVWRLQDVPSDVRCHLNLPATDEGIDLVARTKEGGYWAIQCKYREDIEHSLSRRELSTFTDLTFTLCRNFEMALVCTTADRSSHKLKLYGERISFLAGDIWRGLNTEFFTTLRMHLAGKVTRLVPRKPRPHQMEALKDAVVHFVRQGNPRGKLIMPCGAGKSLTGWWLAEHLGALSILVAVPSLALVKQTLEVWARESVATGHSIRWTAVCSDESVARDEREDAAVLVQDLGVRVHTNPQEISDWLAHPHTGSTVVFTTYQSGRVIAEAARNAGFTFDLGILDEAHKTVGKKGNLFDHLLHDSNITIRRRVFMTATERRYRGDSDNILSMDNPQAYGDTFHLLSFKGGLECRPPILSDYKIVTVAVTRSEIATLVRANLLVRPDRGVWSDDVEAEMLVALVALRKAMQRYPIRHAVSFHSSIARARSYKESQQAFGAAFPDFGNLETFHVTGSTPTAVRKRELDSFAAADRSLITNARCLTEGVDVPGIDCVLFADPKRSTVDIVQAVGRALRPAPGKDLGYVVIPVLVEDIGTPSETPFDSVLMVLRALAANDERIVEYFRTVSQGRQYAGRAPVEFAVPDGVEINAEEFVQAIELKAWNRLAKLSWRPFEEAREFVRGLGLRSYIEWLTFCQNQRPDLPRKPSDIPRDPYKIYSKTVWQGWGNWLGTGNIATRGRTYLTFSEAKIFVHSLGLKRQFEWVKFTKGQLAEKGLIPCNIPADPASVYKEYWQGYGDWLGTGRKATSQREYRTFDKARDFARSLGLKNQNEWRAYAQKGPKPEDIPANPEHIYKVHWQGFGDWLGTGNIAPFNRQFITYDDSIIFVHSLNLKSQNEWKLYCNGKIANSPELPSNIPKNPYKVYRESGWQNWGHWLGTNSLAPGQQIYLSFTEARNFVHTLKLMSFREWKTYCKSYIKLKSIPTAPDLIYQTEWKGWADWLGTKNKSFRDYRFEDFFEARKFVRKLGLKTVAEWLLYRSNQLPMHNSKPENIPSNPNRTYKHKGWISWPDWLGTS